jgi:long-subunit fatty acid transport protein
MILALAPAMTPADQGTTAASFLKLGTSPRAIAMADAFGGVADDVSAIQYNAAGLAFLDQKEFTLMHAVWFQDIFYDYGALAWPIEGIGTLGLSFFYLSAGTFEKVGFDAFDNPVSLGDFTASSMVAGLAFSRQIVSFLSAGINIKMLNESIDTFSAGSVAVDVSALYKTPIEGLSAGLNIQNLGPSLGFEQAFSLPINVRLGVGYKPADNITVGMDYTQPIETAGLWSVGGEYGYRDTLFVRMGYRYQGAIDYNQTYTGFGPAVASGLNLGLGLKLYKNYSADYAYAPYGFLGTTHRISLTFKFD